MKPPLLPFVTHIWLFLKWQSGIIHPKGFLRKQKYPQNEPKGRQMSCCPGRHAHDLIPASWSDKPAYCHSFPLSAYARSRHLHRQVRDILIKKNYNMKREEAPFPLWWKPRPDGTLATFQSHPSSTSFRHSQGTRSDNSTDSVKTLFGIFTLFLRPKLFLN